MTRTWSTSGFEKTPLAASLDKAYPRIANSEVTSLNPDVIRIIRQMYASEADRVIHKVEILKPAIQALTVTTIRNYDLALAANDRNMRWPIDLLRIAA